MNILKNNKIIAKDAKLITSMIGHATVLRFSRQKNLIFELTFNMAMITGCIKLCNTTMCSLVASRWLRYEIQSTVRFLSV